MTNVTSSTNGHTEEKKALEVEDGGNRREKIFMWRGLTVLSDSLSLRPREKQRNIRQKHRAHSV